MHKVTFGRALSGMQSHSTLNNAMHTLRVEHVDSRCLTAADSTSVVFLYHILIPYSYTIVLLYHSYTIYYTMHMFAQGPAHQGTSSSQLMVSSLRVQTLTRIRVQTLSWQWWRCLRLMML